VGSGLYNPQNLYHRFAALIVGCNGNCDCDPVYSGSLRGHGRLLVPAAMSVQAHTMLHQPGTTTGSRLNGTRILIEANARRD